MNYATLATISLIVAGLVMINSGPVVHAQSTFPVPPPPTSKIIQQPGTQPCVNSGSNVLGPAGKQTVNQENQCTGTPKNVNQAPIANAGPSQAVSPGSLVTLSGAGSFAQNGATIVAYQWTQTSGTQVSLNGANTATPTFVAPSIGTALTFSLTVTDSRGAVSSPSTVSILVKGNVNQPPIANAGPSQTVSPGVAVTLNGAGSFAQNGATIVSYSWVQTSGIAVSLNGANMVTPVFTAPVVATSLIFSLTVTDSNGG